MVDEELLEKINRLAYFFVKIKNNNGVRVKKYNVHPPITKLEVDKLILGDFIYAPPPQKLNLVEIFF